MTNKRRQRGRGGKNASPLPILELTLGEPAHGGACVARDADGRVVFVRLGVPGETVRAQVTKTQSRLAWADVVQVLEPSPDRVESPFQQAEHLGGAELAHVRPQAQRGWKQSVLRTQLRRVGGERLDARVSELYGKNGPAVLPPAGDEDPSDPLLGRRTRARFVVGAGGRLGMRAFRSHQVIPVDDYPFLDPCFEEAGVFSDPSWRSLWKRGDRVTLVAPDASDPLVVVGDSAWNLERMPTEPLCLWEVDAADLHGEFTADASGFWQVHPAAPATLASAVTSAAGPLEGQQVMELYSGSGLLSYFLKGTVGPAGRLVTLEQSAAAVKHAERNLHPVNEDCRAEFFVGEVDADSIGELGKELDNNTGVIILDPPREGAGSQVTEAIEKTGAERIVLLSCDPAAGARDMADLQAKGFELEQIVAWDLFPHTHHFEVLSVFAR